MSLTLIKTVQITFNPLKKRSVNMALNAADLTSESDRRLVMLYERYKIPYKIERISENHADLYADLRRTSRNQQV